MNQFDTHLASYPGRVGGERRPGIDCLRMRDHSQGIRLRLEIVGKINTYTSIIITIVRSYTGKYHEFNLLPSVLLRVRSTSNNANDNKRVMFFPV